MSKYVLFERRLDTRRDLGRRKPAKVGRARHEALDRFGDSFGVVLCERRHRQIREILTEFGFDCL
jgi:16S rRNA U516 pseudouridylate synthase RsuA-like enzyme